MAGGSLALEGVGVAADKGPSENACDLLTTDEASQVLGVPSSGGDEDTDRSHGTYCEWVSKDSDDGTDASSAGGSEIVPYFISLEVDRGDQAVQDFESGKRGAGDKVDGLGSDAYFSAEHGLNVRNGDLVFSTYADGNDQHPLTNADRRRLERQAAEIVAKRLGHEKDTSVVKSAKECARTRRCTGTRYHACDLLHDDEVVRLTGFELSKVDGASAIPADGSKNAALCEYSLASPDDDPDTGDRVFRTVELRIEPDPREAKREYEREQKDGKKFHNTQELPELGADAFYDTDFDTATVYAHDALLSVGYDVYSGRHERSAELKAAVIALAKLASGRVA
jgi:hypothetical protein